jgi:hypothetical protein
MPPLLRTLLRIDWNSRSVKLWDWGLAALSLAVGIYLMSWLWLAMAVFGAAMAWWRPMGRLQGSLNAAFRRN